LKSFMRMVVAGLILVLPGRFIFAASTDNPTIVVTATRTPQTIDNSLAAVTVITRDDINASQARDIVDLLRRQAGIDMSRDGGPGQQTSLFLRGTNSNHVLVLIDGVRVASANTGTFAWPHLALSQIERIEIVRGPRSSLYGSDAIGGIIQIFTRRGDGLVLDSQAGSYNSWRLGAGLAAGQRVKGNIFVSSEHSDGFSAQNSSGFSFDPDNDAYNNLNVTAGLDGRVGKQQRAALKFWRSQASTDFDVGTSDSANQSLSLALSGAVTGYWTHHLVLGVSQDNLETISAFPSRISSHRRMAEWQNDLALSDDMLLTLGLSHIHDQGENFDVAAGQPVFNRSTNMNALFGDWQLNYGHHEIAAGLRLDHHSTFGSHTTGQLAWGYHLNDKLRLYTSYGTAFRSPSISELFHPGFFGGFFAGNPALRPETSWSAELGANYSGRISELQTNLYTTRVEDLIAYQGVNSQAVNIAQARIDGLEVHYQLHFHDWLYQNDLTLMSARDEYAKQDLLRRPDQKLSTQLNHPVGRRGQAGMEWLLSSRRRDVGNVKLGGYGLVNLSGQYQLSKALRFTAKVENVFDKQYQLAAGFNTPGRSVFAGFEYREPS